MSEQGGQSSFTMCRLNLNWKILAEILSGGGPIIFHHVQVKCELKNFRWDPGQMGATCPHTHKHHSDFISHTPLGCTQLKLTMQNLFPSVTENGHQIQLPSRTLLLKELFALKDMNNEHAELLPSVNEESLFKTTFQVEIYKLEKLCLLWDLNNEWQSIFQDRCRRCPKRPEQWVCSLFCSITNKGPFQDPASK